MRFFKDFPEAINEIHRDLKEMGVRVENTHMQDKEGSFPTYELHNYAYTVLEPRFSDLKPVQPWCDLEWAHRVRGIKGEVEMMTPAALARSDEFINWEDFIEKVPGKPDQMAYTYGERFAESTQVLNVIDELQTNPESRQMFISLWNPTLDAVRFGVRRVPCTLGYHVLYRNNRLHMTYMMRSCDFLTHFQNDIWLAMQLQHYIVAHIRQALPDAAPGRFSHFINSFHVYQNHVKDVF